LNKTGNVQVTKGVLVQLLL